MSGIRQGPCRGKSISSLAQLIITGSEGKNFKKENLYNFAIISPHSPPPIEKADL
jgi:hypothetical protein